MLRFAKFIAALGLFAVPFSSQAQEESCTSNFLVTSKLECVSCGIQKAHGNVPSEKFLALLGFAAQHYYSGLNPHERDVDSVAAMNGFYQHVIQQVQAYGYCVGVKVKPNGDLTDKKAYDKVSTNMLDLVYPSITGSRSRVRDGEYNGPLTGDQMKKMVKHFGFKNEDDVKTMFQDDFWRTTTPAQRQKHFRTYAEKSGVVNGSDDGDNLKECLKQLKNLHTGTTDFNLNSPNEANQKFCKTVAGECGIASSFCMGNTAPAPVPASSSGNNQPVRRNLYNSTNSSTATGAH
ncbi:hypothetical protein [Bdellovibrio sp. HCB337]|uniref:hypothetical protein n=1 Tax=Bdellovibrio sp. HCB337 TaxID=3394358 RepID=UPI0039A65E50